MSLNAEPSANRAGANAPSRARKTLARLCGATVGAAGAAAAIGAAGAGVAQAQTPALKQGSKGPEVSRVQQALGLGNTGYYGPVTQQRVTEYQRAHGLHADGVAGRQTQSALFQSGGSSPKSSGSTSSSPKSGRSVSSPSRSSGSSSSSGSSVPNSIKQCESGGNYHAVNPKTGAGGAYQIMPSTWRANGGSGSPQNASPQEQDRIASKIYRSGGRSQWTC